MVYQRRRMWWGDVYRANGARRRITLETRDPHVAKQLQRMLDVLRDSHRWSILDAVFQDTLAIGEVYQAFSESRLVELEQRLRAAPADDRDLEPFVALWRDSMLKSRRPSAATAEVYVRQVRTLLPAGVPFARSALTVARIAEWRDSLSNPDKAARRRGAAQPNRFLAALSSFVGFLAERGIMTENPVSLVRRAREGDPRCTYLHREDAIALVDAMDDPWRALHALMAGSGMEISAALEVRHGDIDAGARTVRARGSKTASRDRTVKVTEDWAWDRVAAYVRAHRGLRDALLFAELFPVGSSRVQASDRSRRALLAACTARGVAGFRQHDWRHTYAVQAVRDGMPLPLIAKQLGHQNTLMAQKVYGRFLPEASDYAAYAAKLASSVTPTVTPAASGENG